MEHSLHYQLRACHTNCQKAIITKLRQTGDLRPGEPKILEFLLEHEPCEQKTIAAGCGLDPASVTGILGRMESRRLVTRACRDGNRRSLFVTMTDYGRTLAREVEETFALVDGRAVEGLTAGEQETFLALLAKVNRNLEDLTEGKEIEHDSNSK